MAGTPYIPPLKNPKDFKWPEGKQAALSLSFDDARLTQPDTGFEIFNRHNVRATFYVVPHAVEKRLDAWKQAVAFGHEIGNHTISHPCGGAAAWTRHNALEDYTLERIAAEIDGATEQLKSLLGVTPTTFAYPCGHIWVGRGVEHRSYVPLIADRFLIGRGGSGHAIPGFLDTAMVPTVGSDRITFDRFKSEISRATAEGNWLTLTGHEIGDETCKDALTTSNSVLEEICRYAQDPVNGIWVDTIENIGKYVIEQRKRLTA